MIVVFIGSPFSGKGTQAKLLGEKLNIPVFGMGNLIRKAYEKGDKRAIEGFRKYSMEGMHLPVSLKFDFLKKEMDKAGKNFILDNFPANKGDLEALNDYFKENDLKVDKVFYLNVSQEEMKRRYIFRGRKDDDLKVTKKRREIQDKDRLSVLKYFDEKDLLIKVNGENSIKKIQDELLANLDST
ncbi:MAG: nucleoside monophosphate kinase [Candidatus Levyibacteriota bacterium]